MLKEAKESFEESLFLMEQPNAPPLYSSNKGGVLLGIGLVMERQGKEREGEL